MAKLGKVCDVRDGTHDSPKYVNNGFPLITSKNLTSGTIDFSDVNYISEEDYTKINQRSKVDVGDIIMPMIGTIGNPVIVDIEPAFAIKNVSLIKFINEEVYNRYILYVLDSDYFKRYIDDKNRGGTQKFISLNDIREFDFVLPDLLTQHQIAANLDKVTHTIDLCNAILEKLDLLVKSRFVEMFGDFKTNTKGWKVAKFTDIAIIDGNMTTDFEKYADYPHIGIDSIEKDTGDLKGYRTVVEDSVVSGKYLFTPQHIIYSKIRPNLNKVALPDFYGVCSADAYPILPDSEKCNRLFLAYVMRSSYFLDYILQFCNRTNLPKVNRKEVSGFSTPLPPLALQEQFAAFVKQTDKSKLAVKQVLEKAETLKKALMQEYFG